MRPIALLLLASLLPCSAQALEIRFHPGEVVYTWEVDPARQLSTAVLQNVAVVQGAGEPVTVDSVVFEVRAGGATVQSLTVPAARLDAAAKRLSALDAQGLLKLYDFHFQTGRSLGAGVRPAATRALAPGSGLLVTGTAFLLAGPADEITVTALGRDAAGRPVTANGSVKVAAHRSPNTYRFPLAGTWYVGAAPSLHSHHRWVTNQEFALDLVALGGDGTTRRSDDATPKGDGARLEDYYGHGREVLAVADGVVVEAAADATEAHDRLRQPGESAAAFEQRTVEAQIALLAKSPRSVLGNYVVVQHAGGEFSQSVHLKQGSVRVKVGDAVKQGQVLGQLGHTGNSTEPHLHFQLTDGPDPLFSRGLPIVFQGVEVVGLDLADRPLQTGWIVRTADGAR
jgi:murein DD-endopeptidase MepM/ murein hydrolase activator NlpD